MFELSLIDHETEQYLGTYSMPVVPREGEYFEETYDRCYKVISVTYKIFNDNLNGVTLHVKKL